jgi:prevent-host-death family protein
MKKMNIREVRAILGRVDEVVGKEGEIVLTVRGKPLARIVPLQSRRRFPSLAWLRKQMKPLRVGSEVLIRAERDED